MIKLVTAVAVAITCVNNVWTEDFAGSSEYGRRVIPHCSTLISLFAGYFLKAVESSQNLTQIFYDNAAAWDASKFYKEAYLEEFVALDYPYPELYSYWVGKAVFVTADRMTPLMLVVANSVAAGKVLYELDKLSSENAAEMGTALACSIESEMLKRCSNSSKEMIFALVKGSLRFFRNQNAIFPEKGPVPTLNFLYALYVLTDTVLPPEVRGLESLQDPLKDYQVALFTCSFLRDVLHSYDLKKLYFVRIPISVADPFFKDSFKYFYNFYHFDYAEYRSKIDEKAVLDTFPKIDEMIFTISQGNNFAKYLILLDIVSLQNGERLGSSLGTHIEAHLKLVNTSDTKTLLEVASDGSDDFLLAIPEYKELYDHRDDPVQPVKRPDIGFLLANDLYVLTGQTPPDVVADADSPGDCRPLL